MGNDVIITPLSLLLGYIMLVIPLGIILWYKVPLFNRTLISAVRMTVQLLLVGFYLQFIFKLDNPFLNIAWLLIMLAVADVSIIHGCKLKIKRFAIAVFIGLLVGTFIPLLIFIGFVIRGNSLFDARFMIPIGGMILGNCLRANIIGVGRFYESIKMREKEFIHSLSQGASLYEAVLPFLREAFHAAMSPTIATMGTIGLVSLPGMMTGVILGGAEPVAAIKYQIAIMVSIFASTSITTLLTILMTMKTSFNEFGVLDEDIFVG